VTATIDLDHQPRRRRQKVDDVLQRRREAAFEGSECGRYKRLESSCLVLRERSDRATSVNSRVRQRPVYSLSCS
jgi:hypothetical protein